MIAERDSTILLRGETGTGKGLLAMLIHRQSRRAREPFVHIDCTTFSPGLFESEVFGHERGAFTGAAERRLGRFELARGGTAFLDEIGDLDRGLQTKLLRVLQNRSFERLGGNHTLTMRARVVAATNRNLEGAMRDGSFRSDLYYRLNVLELWIPPLRSRKQDLRPLVHHFIDELGSGSCTTPDLEESFLAALHEHDWPGNARELHNFVERALIHAAGRVLDGALARSLLDVAENRASSYGPHHGATNTTLGSPDRSEIVTALHATGGNVTRAAHRLALPRSTLRYRMSRLGLS